jgi:poly-gamma-glutamate capsule biosynthesis protein CapA/YwtB (metallophosphatase superfamily)
VRTLALIARAGAVLVLVGLAVGLVVEPDPRPPVLEASSTDADGPGTGSTTESEQVPDRGAPTALVTFALAGGIDFDAAGSGAARRGTLFADVQADLAGDVVVGTLVGDVTGRQATALARSGFSVLALADPTGRAAQSASATLVAAGLQSAGRPGRLTLQRVAGTTVGLLGVDPAAADVRPSVRQAVTLADLVVVALPVPAQASAIRRDLLRTARAAIDAGADLVVGVGAGDLRAMEWHRGRLVAYGLGGFAGGAAGSSGDPAAILRLTLRADGTFETGVLVATVRAVGGRARLDPDARALALVDERSQAAFGTRAVEIGADGVIAR